MKKSLLALLIVILATGTVLAGPVQENKDRVCVIENTEQLKQFRQAVNNGMTELGAVLSGDIDLGGQSWSPIGDSEETAYNGNFDGNGYRILGLSIRGSSPFLGLFGCLDDGGTVANLSVENASIVFDGNGGTNIGVISGISKGIIDNCAVIKCSVRATGTAERPQPIHAGAVTGYNSNGVIIDCLALQNQINITDGAVSNSEAAAGGICGMNTGLLNGVGLIMNCESRANEVIVAVKRTEIGCYGGGIVGLMLGGVIRNCTVYGGKVVSPVFSGSLSSLGGVLGSSMRSSYIENCTVEGDILIRSDEGSKLSNLGGLAGSLLLSNVSECLVRDVILSAAGEVTHNIGGISGAFGGGKISNCRVANILMPKNPDKANLQGAVAGLLFIYGNNANGVMMVENTWFHKTVANGLAIGTNEALAEIDAKPFDYGPPYGLYR